MSLFDRDRAKHINTPGEGPRDATARAPLPGSSPTAEESAARIAELVRRTAERESRPSSSSVARPQVSAAQPPMPVPAPNPPPSRDPRAHLQPVRPARGRPSRRILFSGGTVATVLIVAGLLLAHSTGSPSAPAASTRAASSGTPAPAGYVVRLTDVVTDCANHSHGRTTNVFKSQNCVRATRSLATGKVSGRPTLFVVSRIQMKSGEAAASIKEVLDATGTGNLNDLLREGKTFPGAPGSMPDSGYASVQTGPVVVVAEAGFIDGGRSASTNPALRAAAAEVAALATAQI